MYCSITQETLQQYTCSEQFYYNPLFKKIKYSEGVKYVSDNGCAWMITDIIVNCIDLFKHGADLFSIIFKKNSDNTATITYSDGNSTIFKNEKYQYVDCSVNEIKFFILDNHLILSSEY